LAVLRPPDPRAGSGAYFLHGADEVLLAVDIERGVVPRAEARIDGEPFAVFEIADIVFDEELPDELFRFESPDGSPMRSTRGAFTRPEPMSVEEPARRASFTVVVPTLLPRGWIVIASYTSPNARPLRPESVVVQVLEDRHQSPRLTIRQAGEPLSDGLEWEVVEHSGRPISILVYQGPGGGYDAKVEAGGTHVRANGDLEREAFLDITASLAPAPHRIASDGRPLRSRRAFGGSTAMRGCAVRESMYRQRHGGFEGTDALGHDCRTPVGVQAPWSR
jgi:hypothetical protein